MLLAIDVGNTNIVFALFDRGGKHLESWRMRTEAGQSKDEYAAFLSQVMSVAGHDFAQIDDVIVSSVVPEVQLSLTRFCRKYLDCEPLYVTKDTVDVEIDLERPDDVGADRLVNAVAVISEYKTPAVVIDFGTATTFDVIDGKSAYAGGVIATGINLSLDALHRAASKLPKVRVEKVPRVIGKTTVQAMQSGLYFGYKSMIEGVIEEITNELGATPYVIATGGLASIYADDIEAIEVVDDDLTLKGLYEIYKKIKA